ncbi:MAG TPA: hypothetical protein VFA96_04460, partial [Nocardioides sp.]|nr:hypothetical protein [Nocardioides sp.]
MRPSPRILLAALCVPAAGLAVPSAMAAPAAGHSSAARDATAHRKPAFSVRTLDFHVKVPNEAPNGTGTQHCLIVGDLYKPASASRHHRVPVILTTNGFGGSKDDQAGLAKVAARHGYGVLSYSGLGFGGS